MTALPNILALGHSQQAVGRCNPSFSHAARQAMLLGSRIAAGCNGAPQHQTPAAPTSGASCMKSLPPARTARPVNASPTNASTANWPSPSRQPPPTSSPPSASTTPTDIFAAPSAAKPGLRPNAAPPTPNHPPGRSLTSGPFLWSPSPRNSNRTAPDEPDGRPAILASLPPQPALPAQICCDHAQPPRSTPRLAAA